MNKLIIEKELLSADESRELYNRIMTFENSFSREDHLLHFIGYPYYVSCINKKPRDSLLVRKHNEFMSLYFGDVLKKIIEFFQNEFPSELIYYSPEISYPGFHAIKVMPKSKSLINFHQDTEYIDAARDFPHLGIDISQPGPSFTVILVDDPELKSGLLYLEGESFTHERLNVDENRIRRNKGLLALSSYHPYKLGFINLHSGIAHSVFAHNLSDGPKFRVSLQGHLIKTIKGYLLFW